MTNAKLLTTKIRLTNKSVALFVVNREVFLVFQLARAKADAKSLI